MGETVCAKWIARSGLRKYINYIGGAGAIRMFYIQGADV